MSWKSPIALMRDAILAHDPKLTPEQAGKIAAAIGDTPITVGTDIVVRLGNVDYRIPESVIFPEDDEPA